MFIVINEHVTQRCSSLMCFKSYSRLRMRIQYLLEGSYSRLILFFSIGFGAVWLEMKSPVPSIKRKVSSYSKQKVVRAETRRSSHDTFPPSLLLIWAGQSEHPPRSSVNHITLNHTCWAPGCRLQIHQRSETTLSVAGAVVSIGQKMSWLYRDSQTSDATSVT